MISPAAAVPYPGLACLFEHSRATTSLFLEERLVCGIRVYLLQAGNGFLQSDPLLSLVLYRVPLWIHRRRPFRQPAYAYMLYPWRMGNGVRGWGTCRVQGFQLAIWHVPGPTSGWLAVPAEY